MNATDQPRPGRYDRQINFESLGAAGQRRLQGGRALIVGVGGLGCTVADLLARCGVGMLRLVDDDTVQWDNLHRQVLYDEADAAAGTAKAQAAADRIAEINADVEVEPIVGRFDADTADRLARGIDVMVDGTDNFATRFVMNDLSVRDGVPWVFGGAVGAEAQTMTIRPGQGPCLRCVFDSPPPVCQDPSCRVAGVVGPAVAAVAAFQAAEAMKILAAQPERCSPFLLKMDFWCNTIQRIDAARACEGVDCPCCKRHDFEYLHAEP